MLLFTQLANAQSGIEDSLITNSVVFNNLLTKMNEINSKSLNRDSITYSVPAEEKWEFICSYKKGWEESIGFSKSDSTVKMYRQEFNDIHVRRNNSNCFTTDELKKIFYLDDSRFARDTSGNIISSPMVMTKNKMYLIIGLGSYYPNGNQTSWDISNNFYFLRRLE